MNDNFDNRRITLGRRANAVWQGGDNYAFIEESRRITTDPRVGRNAGIGAPDPKPPFASPYLGAPPCAKFCACCGYIVSLYDFRPDPDTWDGLAAWCIGCERKEQKRAIKRQAEQIAEPVCSPPVLTAETPAPQAAKVSDQQPLQPGWRKTRKSHFVRALRDDYM